MLSYLLKYPLSPLLMMQGRGVRKRALVLPEPDGPRAGTTGAGAALRVLIVGDSSAAGVGVDHQGEALSGQLVAGLSRNFRVHWQLQAHTGATTAMTVSALQDLPPSPFDVAVTALGVNDVTSGMPLWLWLRRTRQLQTVLRDRFKVRHIVHSGLPPLHDFPLLPLLVRWILGSEARHFDRALTRLCANDPAASLVPGAPSVTPGTMAIDGFHPGPSVYAAWAGELAAAIRGLPEVTPISRP